MIIRERLSVLTFVYIYIYYIYTLRRKFIVNHLQAYAAFIVSRPRSAFVFVFKLNIKTDSTDIAMKRSIATNSKTIKIINMTFYAHCNYLDVIYTYVQN